VSIWEPESPHALALFASHFSVAIGMRYHFLLLSAVAGVPFGSISRSPKVSALTDDLGQIEIAAVDSFSEKEMLAKTRDIWARRDTLQVVLQERLSVLQGRETRNLTTVQELVREICG